MTRHIILWQLREDIAPEAREEVKRGIKEGLEGLAGVVPGLLSIRVNTVGLRSSNADLMLDALFENEDALRGYSVHPAHVAVADGKVRPFTRTRLCFDFEE